MVTGTFMVGSGVVTWMTNGPVTGISNEINDRGLVEAKVMTWRSEPGPLSFALVTTSGLPTGDPAEKGDVPLAATVAVATTVSPLLTGLSGVITTVDKPGPTVTVPEPRNRRWTGLDEESTLYTSSVTDVPIGTLSVKLTKSWLPEGIVLTRLGAGWLLLAPGLSMISPVGAEDPFVPVY